MTLTNVDPVLVLGRIAAQCDLFTAYPWITSPERRELERRSSDYRLQQMIELDRERILFKANEIAIRS